MKIKNQLVTARNRTWAGTNKKTSITIHETANRNRGANAQAHANLQSNGNVRQASWHIQVDDKEAIRSFPDDVRCWHAGRAAEDSLSLEICINSDGDYDKALANAAEVVKQWRAEHGLGRSDVVDHHHWSGKNCPTILRGRGAKAWADFVASTDPGTNTRPAASKPATPSAPAGKSVTQLAREVIDGKHGNGAARQRSLGSQFQAVQAEVNRILGAPKAPAPARKSNATIAREVIDGKWGNEPQRSQRLRRAGYDAAAIQAEVNRRLGAAPRGKSIATLAREVIDGKWGNEPQRSQRLRAAGHNAAAVQAEVNRRLR